MNNAFIIKDVLRGAFIGLILLSLWSCQTTQRPDKSAAAGIDSLAPAQLQHYQQALQYLAENNPAAAERLLSPLAEQRRDLPEPLLNLALSQYQQQRFDACLNSVNELRKRFAKLPQAHNLAGLLAVEKGEFKAAQAHYEQALKLRPTYAEALYNLALLHDVYWQDINRALTYYKAYLQQVQDDEETRHWVEHLSLSAGS